MSPAVRSQKLWIFPCGVGTPIAALSPHRRPFVPDEFDNIPTIPHVGQHLEDMRDPLTGGGNFKRLLPSGELNRGIQTANPLCPHTGLPDALQGGIRTPDPSFLFERIKRRAQKGTDGQLTPAVPNCQHQIPKPKSVIKNMRPLPGPWRPIPCRRPRLCAWKPGDCLPRD